MLVPSTAFEAYEQPERISGLRAEGRELKAKKFFVFEN
jgi:hypothetical protein